MRGKNAQNFPDLQYEINKICDYCHIHLSDFPYFVEKLK